MERFQPLRVRHRDIEPACDVPRHVNAADGDGVDMDQSAAAKDANRRRSAAEVEDCSPEFGFVVDQCRQSRRVRRRHHRLDAQMASLDDQHEVARGGLVARGDVQVDAQLLADHAFGIEHVARGVERKGGRQRMQDGSSRMGVCRRRCLKNPVDVVLGHGLAAQRRVRAKALRAQEAARHVDDDTADFDACHALGRIDRQPHRMLRGLKIDDRPAFNAARTLVADAEHLAPVRPAAQRLRRLHRRQARDQADDFRGSDVKNRKNGALATRNLPHARRERPEAHGGAAFFGACASAQAAAASSDNRANTRPGTRKSSARTSRSRMRDSR